MLSEWFGAARWVYNQCVAAVNDGTSTLNLTSLRKLFVNNDAAIIANERPYFKDIPYEVRSDAVRDVKKAFASSFALLRAKRIDKFEVKFRSRKDASQSIYMRAKSFSAKHNFFYSTMFGRNQKMRSAEKLPSSMDGDCRLMRTRLGEYYLVMPLKKEIQVLGEKTTRVCALDPGVRTFQTIYNPEGYCFEYGAQDVQRLYRLAHAYDSLQSRWTRVNAKQRKRMKRAGRRIQQKIKNLTRDLHNKLAKELCTHHEIVIIPKFDTSQMIRRGQRRIRSKTARAMVTWSHYTFRQRLISKAEEMGTHVEVVSEEYTSKTCGRCGRIKQNLGGAKVFVCSHCGYRVDRDFNGARNILLKTLSERLPLAADVLGPSPIEDTLVPGALAPMANVEMQDLQVLRDTQV